MILKHQCCGSELLFVSSCDLNFSFVFVLTLTNGKPNPFVCISHDHALGITRLNVYAGLVGLYILRDSLDSGLEGNPLGLPAGKYEHAYAIQVRIEGP